MGAPSKQTKPAGPRYCVFIFCDKNTSHSVLFCSFFKNLSDGLNELPGLQSGSIMAPDDQRQPLSSAENFKTSNNKHFEQSAEPPPGPNAFIFHPPLSRNTAAIRLRVKIQTFYLLLCRSFHHGNKPPFCLLVSPNGKRERKKMVSVLTLSSCPQRHIWLGTDISRRGPRQMWLSISWRGPSPCLPPLSLSHIFGRDRRRALHEKAQRGGGRALLGSGAGV